MENWNHVLVFLILYFDNKYKNSVFVFINYVCVLNTDVCVLNIKLNNFFWFCFYFTKGLGSDDNYCVA